jgi:hypothetical protein
MEKEENIKEKGKGILYLMGRQPGIRPNHPLTPCGPLTSTARLHSLPHGARLSVAHPRARVRNLCRCAAGPTVQSPNRARFFRSLARGAALSASHLNRTQLRLPRAHLSAKQPPRFPGVDRAGSAASLLPRASSAAYKNAARCPLNPSLGVGRHRSHIPSP